MARRLFFNVLSAPYPKGDSPQSAPRERRNWGFTHVAVVAAGPPSRLGPLPIPELPTDAVPTADPARAMMPFLEEWAFLNMHNYIVITLKNAMLLIKCL
jgi:hypothetical protein